VSHCGWCADHRRSSSASPADVSIAIASQRSGAGSGISRPLVSYWNHRERRVPGIDLPARPRESSPRGGLSLYGPPQDSHRGFSEDLRQPSTFPGRPRKASQGADLACTASRFSGMSYSVPGRLSQREQYRNFQTQNAVSPSPTSSAPDDDVRQTPSLHGQHHVL